MVTRKGQTQKWRLSSILIISVVITSILIIRLLQVQIIDRKRLAMIGEDQYTVELQLNAKRGKIFDRHNRVLALDIPSVSIGAHPKVILQKDEIARKLSPLLNLTPARIQSLLSQNKSFVWLARGLPRHIGAQIKDMDCGGLQVIKDEMRCYPHSKLASHLLGFTNVDGDGISGIEYTFNNILSGTPGQAVFQLTADGTAFEHVDYPVQTPHDGSHIVLTIDKLYQAIAEEELRRTVELSDAEGGSVIISDPFTGHLLAIACEPSFNPKHAGQYHPNTWRLRPITDQMEPGSTFKIAMMAAVLNEGLRKPQDIVFCEHGKFEVYDNTIHDTKEHGWLTMHNVVVYSSNIGMAKTMLDVPPAIIYRYAREFGFGTRSGIRLAGESPGVLKLPSEWSGLTPVALAIGHEVAVTPLQMIGMFGVIANGGFLMRPLIVKEILDSSGKSLSKSEPQIIRRVINDTTVESITAMMEDVVLKGTGKRAFIEGLRVCGKTGTARKPKKNTRGFSKNKYMSSFGGFFPAEGKNKICIFVVIDTPRKKYYGGDIAAPCFKKIAKRIIDLEGKGKFLPIKKTKNNDYVTVPSLIGLEIKVARRLLSELGLSMRTVGDGKIIASQQPFAGELVPQGSDLMLQLTPPCHNEEGERLVPNVIGLNLREALNQLAVCGIEAIVDGSGKVVKQQPQSGSIITPNEQCLLRCESAIDLVKLFSD